MKRFRRFITIGMLITAGWSCSGSTTMAKTESPPEGGFIDSRSCAYYYFLQGAQTEYAHQYRRALTAYEKALDCDPDALYISKKLPILHFRLGENLQAAKLLQANIDKDQNDISQYLLLAHLAIQESDRDKAITIYRQALDHEKDNENVMLRLAILLVQKDRLDEGEKLFQRLVADHPDLYLARVYLARLLQMKGENQEAASVYEQTLSANWDTELAFEMIDFYGNLEKLDEMLRLYDAILAAEPDNTQALIGRVQTLLMMNKDQKALEELKALRSTDAAVPSLEMAIAKTLLRLEKVKEAKGVLKELRTTEMASEANYLLGLVSFQEQRMESALSYFQEVKADSDEYSDAIYLQVRILRDFDRYDRAFSLLRKVIDQPQGREPLFFALLSSLYQEKEQFDKARKTLLAGTTMFPENEQLHFELALLLDRAGRRDESLATMEKVLQINPDNPEALNYIGFTWADLNINLQKAKRYVQRAIELKPDNGFIRDSLGWVEYRLGNYETARAELLQALDLEPEDPNIHEHLGDVYRALKRTKKALHSFRKAYQLFYMEKDKIRVK